MFQLLAAYSAAASSSSYLIFFIIINIIFLGSTNNISTSTASTQLNCYDDYAATYSYVYCGSGLYMEYPFWEIDYQQQQPQRYYCGYPGLGITCKSYEEHKPPIINISNQSYYVIGGGDGSNLVGIRSADRQITMVDPDLVETTCPRPRRNFTFNQQDFSDDSAIRLISNNSESVIGQASHTSTIDAINGYMQILQRGFGVSWITPSECERCESSGGICSFKYGNPITYKCWCKDERQLRHDDADGREYCFDYAALHNKILIGVFTGVGGLMFITLLFVYCKNQRKRRRSIAKNVERFLESYGCRSSQRYKYKDIKKMTNSFKDKLGEGGYGSVFKGKLVDGRPVAVKVLNNDPKKKTNGEDFMNEVATIGSTNHVNIVALIGFCSSGPKRALVYEFMPNGSLEKFIYAKKENSTTTECTSSLSLGWEKLYQIALGIARGLEYLHRGCNTGRILHFDIKPHNILLDENFCPKISDFGLAKLCTARESIVSMLSGGRGTLGYIAPEVYNRNFGGVSYKSDVYSYGMMVLEMVGGRKNIDPFVENTIEIYFPHWIYNHLEKDKDKIEGLLKFEEALDEEMAKKMIMVGLWCIQTHQESRPSMGRVAEMLEGNIKDLQMPPNPFVDPSLHHQPPTS